MKPHESELSEGEEHKAPPPQKEKKGQKGKPPRPPRGEKEKVLSDLRRLPYEEVEWVLSHFPTCRPPAGSSPHGEVPLSPAVLSSTPDEVPKRAGRTDLPRRSAASGKRTAKAKERKLRKQLLEGGAGLSKEVKEGLERKIKDARRKREEEKAKLALLLPAGTSKVSFSSSSSSTSGISPAPTSLTVTTSLPPSSPPHPPSASPTSSPTLHPSATQAVQDEEAKKREAATGGSRKDRNGRKKD